MLLEGGEAEPTLPIPQPDLAIGPPRRHHRGRSRIRCTSRLINESCLVEDVALGLPLPDHELAQLFHAQGDPVGGHGDGRDLVLAQGEGVDLGQGGRLELPD